LASKSPPRRLFLDDDPDRASVFLREHPDAVWVQTVPECLTRLAEPWDEVHLDHDLGGEQFVDVNRADCGMEVVRWLGQAPRKHLRKAQFTVHSHNLAAAFEMTYRLQLLGYRVQARPFGVEPPPATEPTSPQGSPWARLRRRAVGAIRRLRGLAPLPDPDEASSADYVP
jgi:hypothetical protein